VTEARFRRMSEGLPGGGVCFEPRRHHRHQPDVPGVSCDTPAVAPVEHEAAAYGAVKVDDREAAPLQSQFVSAVEAINDPADGCSVQIIAANFPGRAKSYLFTLQQTCRHQPFDRAMTDAAHSGSLAQANSPGNGTDDSPVLSGLVARSPSPSHSLCNPSQSAPIQRHPTKADPVLPGAQIWREGDRTSLSRNSAGHFNNCRNVSITVAVNQTLIWINACREPGG
jgi:hypothetical protein